MKPLRSTLFIVCCSLFLLHQLMQKVLHLSYPLFDRYLDNLLAMPIILSLWQAEKILLFNKNSNYKLMLLQVLMATIYIIIVAEVLFPLLSDKFTADWLDIIFYFAGSAIFYRVNKSSRVTPS